ncbi:MAG: RNA methyltransferase, partial [bacterium]
YLILRLGETQAAEALGKPFVKPFDITGRPMKGWVMVDGSRWEDPEELERWLAVGRDFALTLPAK